MSSDSDVYPKGMPWVKRAGIAAFLAVLSLPMLGACGQKTTPDRNAGGVTTLRFFEHDTQQASLDLGPQGTGPGDQFIYSGDLFDHAEEGKSDTPQASAPRSVATPPLLAMSSAPPPSSSIVDRSPSKAWPTVLLSSVGGKLSRSRSWVAQESIVMPAAMALPKCRSTCRIKPTPTSLLMW
jgi:hypothetical protein